MGNVLFLIKGLDKKKILIIHEGSPPMAAGFIFLYGKPRRNIGKANFII